VTAELKGFKRVVADKYMPLNTTQAHGLSQVATTFAAKTRGVFHHQRIKLTSIFPFGLWRVWAWHPADFEIVIYPDPKGDQKLALGQIAVEGESNHSTGGDDFRELRPYEVGESPYHIDWQSYARGHGLQVKRFDEGGLSVANVDFFGTTSGDFEARVSQLSKWIVECQSKGVPFNFRTPALEIQYQRNTNTTLISRQCLRHLADWKGDSEKAA